jgi:transcription antitermination protein NusB
MARAAQRSASRLAAVQALYQMDVGGSGVTEAMAEFATHWTGREVEGVEYQPAEEAFFHDILQGVVREQAAIDRRVDEALDKAWPLTRIEVVLRAILRAGAYELMFRRDVPARVAISEYVDVARAFYGSEEAGLVNAVLDAVARQARQGELDQRA